MRGAAGTPFCVIVKILPAITNRARRDCLPVFAATEYTTVPFPLLLSPSTILIQSALVKVVQLQRLLVETVTFPVEAPPPTERFDAESV